jgi:hypothetical protein
MASATGLRNAAPRAHDTPDLAGDKVSSGWLRDNLRNVRTARPRRDKYSEMAERLERRTDLPEELRKSLAH